MFCKICDNFMDITNNIVNINLPNQSGGNDCEISSDYDINSSEYDTSINSSNNLTENNVNKILEGGDLNENFKVEDLNKNPVFNKLNNNLKTVVINKILEKIPINNKSEKYENINFKDSYFYCKSCGYYEKIPDKQFIFSRGYEIKDDSYNLKFNQYKFDVTLPNSKKYICINDTCATHNDPKLKMAVFFRQKGSYNIKYICNVCDSIWNTFVEK